MITIDIGLTSAEVRNPSELRREPFTTGTVGREVLLVFSGEWSGLAKTAVFVGSDDTRDVLITGTELSAVVVVPHEVLVKPCGELTLSVYGTNGDTIAIPTVYTSLGMIHQGADPSGDPGTDPSLPIWAQVEEEIDELAEEQTRIKEDLTTDIQNRIKQFYTTGTEGNIPDSSDGTLRELKVYGETKQGGKNLLNLKNAESGDSANVKNIDGVLQISGTPSSTVFWFQSFKNGRYPITLGAGTYTISCKNGANGVTLCLFEFETDVSVAQCASNETRTFTLTNAKSLRFHVYASPSYDGVSRLMEIQLERGSAATPYEPYMGGDTPTPDHPIAIRSVVNPVVEVDGYNLFNPTFEGGLVNGVSFVKNADKTYTLNGTATANWQQVLGTMDIEVGTYRLPPWIAPDVNAFLNYDAWWIENFTINVPVDNVAFFINIPNGHVFDNVTIKPLITRDLTATYAKYVPYKPKIIAQLPGITLRKVGDVADYVDVERGVVVRNIAALRLTNNAAFGWRFDTSKVSQGMFYAATADGQGLYFDTFKSGGGIALMTYYYNPILCPYLDKVKHSPDQNISWAYMKENLGTRIGFYPFNLYANLFINLPISVASTAAEFYNWLANNDVTVYGVAATSTEEPIPADILAQLRAVKSYYPQTNVSVTSDEVDGAAEFIYPVSLESGWEYVKRQIGDNREYIYDISDLAVDAYINSEYAATLAEMALDI